MSLLASEASALASAITQYVAGFDLCCHQLGSVKLPFAIEQFPEVVPMPEVANNAVDSDP
jgi:hypothetical protein